MTVMQLSLITDSAVWDRYLTQAVATAPFSQSAGWGEVLVKAGRRLERLAVLLDRQPILLAQVVFKPILGPWWYALSPQGPVFVAAKAIDADASQAAILEKDLVAAAALVGNYLRKQGCLGWQVEPAALAPLHGFSLRRVPDINPPATLVMPLTRLGPQWLADFSSKTRYNIRLAERHGLLARRAKDFSVFWGLFTATAKRDSFPLYPRPVYEAVWASPALHQITIYKGEMPLSVAGWWYWNQTLVYLYGGSDHRYREYMAPSLLQWEGIKLASELGATSYDFFGLAPTAAPPQARREFSAPSYPFDKKHRYAGLTRFKLGFGGIVKEDPGTFVWPLRPALYNVYRARRAMRRAL